MPYKTIENYKKRMRKLVKIRENQKTKACVHCGKEIHPYKYFCDMDCETAYCDAQNQEQSQQDESFIVLSKMVSRDS